MVPSSSIIHEDGSNPYCAWFGGLPAQAAAKVTAATFRLEMGNLSSVKWIGTIGEYRIDWGSGYRIYTGPDGERLIVLLGGGTKKREQADIERAAALWAEYKARRAACRVSTLDQTKPRRRGSGQTWC
jgi:putative addiction module killer protein